jgi:hypothetical protein
MTTNVEGRLAEIERKIAHLDYTYTDCAILIRLARLAVRMADTLDWIHRQKDSFFAECSQAEEIVTRCSSALAAFRAFNSATSGEGKQ